MKKEDFDPNKCPDNLRVLIHQVCARPMMYVGSYSFDSVYPYIIGYYHALSHLKRESNDPMELMKFGKWLAQKFDQPGNIAWPGTLMAVYPRDETLLEKLPTLFEEYLNDKAKT